MASLVWFLAGRQTLSNTTMEARKKLDAALVWQCVAVLLIIILCVKTVLDSQWLGFACGFAVLIFEIRSIRQTLSTQDQQK